MKTTSREARARSARNRLIALAAVIVALATTTALLLTSHATSTPTPAARASLPSTTVPSPGASSGAPAVVPATVLPKPSRVTGGVPVGYPHTTLGAVSAAAHFYDTVDLLSPSEAQRQAQIMADPAYAVAFGIEVRDAGEQARRSAGLPAEGESGAGIYLTSQSRAFQVSAVTSGRVVVWLLSDTQSAVNGITHTSEAVNGAVMIWTHNDWKIAIDDVPGPAPATATPGTTQAAQEGWQSLAYAT